MTLGPGWDIIGDVHGHFELLERLFDSMGYERSSPYVWRHPSGRRPLFLGDMIDRGDFELTTVRTVMAMTRSGSALALMGNHEYNDLCDWLGLENFHRGERHVSFLRRIQNAPDFEEVLDWMMSLPLWLDLGPLRAVHACWDPEAMRTVSQALGGCRMSEALFRRFNPPRGGETQRGARRVHDALERVLSGIMLALPPGVTYRSRRGKLLRRVRIRWWDDRAASYRAAAFMEAPERVPPLPLEKSVCVFKPEKPTFFGHYNLCGLEPRPVSEFAACVDYGAGSGGALTAYRWCEDEPGPLKDERFGQVGSGAGAQRSAFPFLEAFQEPGDRLRLAYA